MAGDGKRDSPPLYTGLAGVLTLNNNIVLMQKAGFFLSRDLFEVHTILLNKMIKRKYVKTKIKYLGPVVQSIVSLTSSLRVISLTVLADSIHNIPIFFAEKM